MDRQAEEARKRDLEHLQDGWELADLVNKGELVDVPGNEDYELFDVSFPFARPYVRNFIERLASHYRTVFCGEKLVVTSLTRPTELQPINSHPKSVHPVGIAVDFRVPTDYSCRIALENLLLSQEVYGKIDVTRERMPPHYHVAILSDDF